MILTKGQRNQLVTRLQILLNQQLKPSPGLKTDGMFGDKTHKSVVAFQKSHNLSADGIVNNQTWNALGYEPAKPVNESITLDVAAPWFDVAKAELGIKENSKNNKHNARILQYHATTTLGAKTDETPWCSSFVNWVIVQAGYKGTNNALAKSWLTWGIEAKTPQRGDIVVIKKKASDKDKKTGSLTGYHVGFFDSKSSSLIRLLGGNQRDRVNLMTFSLKGYEILSYRRPEFKSYALPALIINNMSRVTV